MFKKLINQLKTDTSNDSVETRRTAPRREVDMCVAVIDGKTYPVENWSMSGVQFDADERLFAVDQVTPFTLKFKLRNTIHSVAHRGRVVRKTSGRIAMAFEPLTLTTQKDFQRVVDDYVAREFASSQA